MGRNGQSCGKGQPSSHVSVGVGSRRTYGVGMIILFDRLNFENNVIRFSIVIITFRDVEN
jgi:hypothetical protein